MSELFVPLWPVKTNSVHETPSRAHKAANEVMDDTRDKAGVGSNKIEY